jgi:hypothetical protein
MRRFLLRPTPLYLLLAVVFLSDAVFSGRAYLFRDVLTFFHPWQFAVREALRSGQLPFWNHDSFCGIPLLANLQSGVFYPVNWLYAALPFDAALTAGMVIHLALAGIGMHGFLRRAGAPSGGAFLGGAAFAFGTCCLSHLEFPMKLGAAVWLPFAWSGLWDAMRRGRRSGVALTAGSIALSVLAGYPQITLLGLLSAGLLAVALAVGVTRNPDLPRAERLHRLGALPVAGGIAGLISAIQLLPARSMATLSAKAAPYAADAALTRSLPPKGLLAAFDPFLFGFPGLDRYWGGEIVEYCFGAFFVGLPALVLAGGAMATAFRPAKPTHEAARFDRAVALFLTAGVALGVLLALGRHTPIYPFLHAHIPGFGRSRWPSTAVFLVAIHLAGLAGAGMTRFLTGEAPMRRAGWGAIALGVAGGAVAWAAQGPGLETIRAFQLSGTPGYQHGPYSAFAPEWIRALAVRSGLVFAAGAAAIAAARHAPWRSRAAGFWMVLVVLELLLAWRAVDAPVARGFYDAPAAGTAALSDELRHRRIYIPRGTDQLGNFLYGCRNPDAFAWAKNALLGNANIPARVAQARGAEPLNPRRHEAFAQAFASPHTPWEVKERIFDLWDAALLMDAPDVRPLSIPGITGEGPPLDRSRHEPQLGRATVLSDWRVHGEGEERALLGELLADEHDPSRITLVEAGCGGTPDLPPEGEVAHTGEAGPAPPARRQLAWRNEPNAIRITGDGGSGGMLRVLESWDPGWTAEVDGRPSPVHRSDFLFLATPIPEGAREIVFRYRPPRFGTGVALSLAGLAAMAFLLISGRQTRQD